MIGRFHYDDDKLAQLLRNEPGGGTNEILAHLDTCKECQARLDRLSSGGLSWDEVNELMRKDDLQVDEHGISVDHDRESQKALSAAATFLQPSDHPDSLGRFARYQVMEFLGRGGMGIVMRTYDPELDRQCAVKVLAPELASNAAARRRFSREAKSAAAVVHPHVVPIQTVDEHGGLPYLVMPVVDGKSLQQRVESDGPLSIIETVRIASQVADGLAAAHVQGLVHRDIKPANILLENGVERVQITDFGLARAIDDASMTRSGVIAGTPQYMSPEQAHGDAIDHRSDLFSLGSMMYFMLTGHSPFRAETTMGVLNRIGNDQPRSLRSIHSEVPEWLEAIVMKLLAKSREERFTSASEVAELLKSWYAHLQSPDTAPRPTSVADWARIPRSRTTPDSSPRPLSSTLRIPPMKRWLIATAAFAFFALAGTVIYLETGKGSLRIESNSDADVPITIRQGDEVVDHLTVTKEGASTRLKAGEYVLQIDDADSEVIITDGEVMLQRGGQWLARISESSRPTDAHEHTTSVDDKQDTEQYQYLVWEPKNRVRLSHWFAKTLQLDDEQLQRVNQLVTDTWQEYIEIERPHAFFQETPDGHHVVTIPSPMATDNREMFFAKRQRLDDEFWRKLDEIVAGEQRARLHALSTARGDGNGDDTWDRPLKDGTRSRPKAYPSIIGWQKDWYPATIEIWKKGTWFHYHVRANGARLGPGDAQELPAVLEHYYQLAEDMSQHALNSPIPAMPPVTAMGPPDESRATAPLRSLNLVDIDESRQLIEVSQGRDSGIEIGHRIYSHSPNGGSIAEVIEVRRESATARVIEVDSARPFRKDAIVYAFSKKSDQPNDRQSDEAEAETGSVEIKLPMSIRLRSRMHLWDYRVRRRNLRQRIKFMWP